MLSKIYQYGQLSKDVYFESFDGKISPVLLYGTELWDIDCQKAIERAHNYGVNATCASD